MHASPLFCSIRENSTRLTRWTRKPAKSSLKQKGYTLPTEIKLLGLIPNLPKSLEQKANPCGCRDRGKTQKKALPGPNKIGQHLGFLDKERSRAVHMVGKYFPQRFFTQKGKERTGILCRVIVRPNRRGKGLGKAFCEDLLTWAKEKGGYRKVHLNTFGRNTAAMSCYKALGFRPVFVKPKCRKVGGEWQDLVIMSLDLPSFDPARKK